MNLLLTKFRLSRSRHGSNFAFFAFFALSAITAFTMGIILYYFATTEKRQVNLSDLKHATSLYASPRAFPDFILTSHRGQKFTQENLKDVWNFIFFGFTHCPDICPLTLSTIDQVVNDLTGKNQFVVQTVFISVDPKRDLQKQLRDYVQHFNQDMIGLTGGDQELKNLTQALGVIYTAPLNNEDKNYSIDHSAHVFLVAPNGNLVALFSAPHKSQTIVKDFKILNAYYNTQVRS